MFESIGIGILQGAALGWAVLGLGVALRLFLFPDLTVEGSLVIGAAVFATLVRSGVSPMTAAIVAVLAGAACGSVTGFLHSRLRINRFLAGICVSAIAYSVSLRVMSAPNLSLLEFVSGIERRSWLAAAFLGGPAGPAAPLLLGALCVGAALVWLALGTRWGLKVRLADSAPMLARSLGVPVVPASALALAGTNALAALSGVVLTLQQGFVDVGMGAGFILVGLASIGIGEVITPKTFTLTSHVVISCVVGSIAYQTLFSICVRLGLPSSDLRLLTAAAVLVVLLPRTLRERPLEEEGL